MTYRQLRAKEPQEQAQNVSTESELSPEQVAAYFRQSSSHQVRNNLESIDLQLSGAQRFAISRGLEADKLVIAHEGDGVRGVSASKLRIDQRARLQEVMAGIYAGKIKVVWAYSVSRLFRDKFGVQVGTFIQACAEHGVKVVIDQMVFDFSDPFVGPMHTAMFQFAAIMAAKENEDRSKLLHEAQKNRALRGQYDGRPLCPGFIVDRDKHSPTYGRYIPYQPHVEVVNRLLKRYREIGGRFNQLAYEVEQIRVVFPPFDDSVDKLNRSRFQLAEVCSVHGPNRQTRVKDKDGKWHFERVGCNLEGPNCQLEGYHIGSEALSHLLQAVELVGYWKVDKAVLTDDSGQPVKNHKGIVNFSDWEYSFYRMSPTLLDGSPNPDWINSRATWTAATTKQVEREPQVLLLDGLLTSPIGSVHYVPSEDAYAVFEKRRLNSHQRSKTLEINAHWIEFEFRRRLLDRIEDTDYEQMLYAALRDVQAHNAQALVSVDEQIANYEQTIKIKQAKLDALGEKFDKPTAEQYNQDILDARANIAALVAKKNEAAVEEQDLQELCEELWNFRNHGKRTNEKLIRFIQLATSQVSIDEYSSHFIRLTVVWCAPFPQVDVCYFYREPGGKLGWNEEEKRDLAKLYPKADRRELLQRFPTKSWVCIAGYAQSQGFKRVSSINTSEVTDSALSLADWNLMQKYGWTREKGAHWLPDVGEAEYGDLSILSYPGRFRRSVTRY